MPHRNIEAQRHFTIDGTYSTSMYGPETIKRMNAESTLKCPEDVNSTLAAIKEAMRQVSQVDIQIQAARKLQAAKPELAKQFELVEQFYIAERKRLLDIEEQVSALAAIFEGLVSLGEQCERERLTLEGRLYLIDYGDSDNVDVTSIREEARVMLPQLRQRCEKVAITIQEISQVMHEYYDLLDGVRVTGVKQKESSSRKAHDICLGQRG